jgi:uncharacterized protein YbcV (DUF1398 family)
MAFPQIVGALTDGGFESYDIDFRRSLAVYHHISGESIELPTHRTEAAIAEALDTGALEAAIREAQNLVPGYSYKGFCLKAKAAGCAGYMVSFIGRRAVYFGRDGAVHTEHFPHQD